MKITADELLEYGLIDGIIPEGKKCIPAIKRMLASEISRLSRMSETALVEERYKKYRNIEGRYKPVNVKRG